jgi:release factor glutamine methyltransferase
MSSLRPVSDTVRAALEEVTARLDAAGCETPEVDAELILANVLGTTRSGLRADGSRALSEPELDRVTELLARRERREPLAYVLGEWGFRRLTLKVDRRALVPRPETEIVVERCLALTANLDQPRILDVGTGSGALALALVDEHPRAAVTGIDSSPDALALARENAARLDLEVELVEHDLFAGFPDGPWDLVVSNPPYVLPEEIDSLTPEVREWEPRIALVGEGTTEAIVTSACDVLRPGGALVLETADGNAARVAGLLRALGYSEVAVTPDLAGRDRVVEGIWP